jgi:hypothetical protein
MIFVLVAQSSAYALAKRGWIREREEESMRIFMMTAMTVANVFGNPISGNTQIATAMLEEDNRLTSSIQETK